MSVSLYFSKKGAYMLYHTFVVPTGSVFGILAKEVDDQACLIVNGVQYNFSQNGTITPPLNHGVNKIIVRVMNSGGFAWKGIFTITIGNQSFQLQQDGMDIFPGDHDLAELTVISGQMVSVIGKLSPPAQFSIGGEHLHCWSVDVELALPNSQFLCRNRICVSPHSAAQSFANQRVRVDGVYEGKHGVESVRHHITTQFIGAASAK